MTDKTGYGDIIGLPHHVSETRPRMSPAERAAQFSPFQALAGYGDAVAEAGRLTDARIEPSESRMAEVNGALETIRMALANGVRPALRVTYFLPDARKGGGGYTAAEGSAKRLDAHARRLMLAGGEMIPFGDILDIELLGLPLA